MTTTAELDGRLADLRGQLSAAEAEQTRLEAQIASAYANGAVNASELEQQIGVLVARQKGLSSAITLKTKERAQAAKDELKERFIGYWVEHLHEQAKLEPLELAVSDAQQALRAAEAVRDAQQQRAASKRGQAEGLKGAEPGLIGANFTSEQLTAMQQEARRRVNNEQDAERARGRER